MRIHDRFLAEPQADRQRLTMAVHHLLNQGLSVWEARALLSGLDRIKRPFPALMSRMRDLEAAQAFLDGTLGRGADAPRPSQPQWPTPGDAEPFSQPERFLVDPQGKATRTCPEYWSTCNEPGGAARSAAGRAGRCPTRPCTIPHRAGVPPEGRPVPAGVETEPPVTPEEGLDPRLRSRTTASLAETGGVAFPPPSRVPAASRTALGSGLSPVSRAIIDGLREDLGDRDTVGRIPSPRKASHDLMGDVPTPQWGEARRDHHPVAPKVIYDVKVPVE